MVISKKFRFVYFHTPKTGGSSVMLMLRQALRGQQDKTRMFIGSRHERNAEFANRFFGRAAELRKHHWPRRLERDLPELDQSTYVTFLSVRNPFARTWSAYRWNQRKERDGKPLRPGAPSLSNLTFEEFICDPEVRDAYPLATARQIRWLPKTGTHIGFIRQENLFDDLNELLQTKISSDLKLASNAFLNVSAKKEEWRGMSDTARDCIKELYAADFRNFNYPTTLNLT